MKLYMKLYMIIVLVSILVVYQLWQMSIIIIGKILFRRQKNMRKVHKIQKHRPINYFAQSRQPNTRLYMKSIGQNWLQIHDDGNLVDVIGLPQCLANSSLYWHRCYGDAVDIFWFNTSGNITTGMVPHQDCLQLQLTQPISQPPHQSHVTPPTCPSPNSLLYLSSSHSPYENFSNLHIIDYQIDGDQSSIQQSHKFIQLTRPISQYTNVDMLGQSTIMYVSQCRDGDESVVVYDLGKMMAVGEFGVGGRSKCFGMSVYEHGYPFSSNIICAYNRQAISFHDTRTTNKIYQHNIDTGCAHTIQKSSTSIQYCSQNRIIQYSLQKGSTIRQPILVHEPNRKIVDFSSIGHNKIGVEDDGNCGITIYA